MPTLKMWGMPDLLANACRYVSLQQTVAKYNWKMLIITNFRLYTVIIRPVSVS